MKKGLLLSFCFLILLLVVGYWTKPTREEFLEKAKSKISALAADVSSDPVMVDVVKMQQDYLMMALDKTVHSKDFFFFSVQSFELGDGQFQYVGVFGKFIPLQSDNPLDQFYQDHEKN